MLIALQQILRIRPSIGRRCKRVNHFDRHEKKKKILDSKTMYLRLKFISSSNQQYASARLAGSKTEIN